GRPGWLAVEPACAGCAGARKAVGAAEFGRLGGEGLRVRVAAAAGMAPIAGSDSTVVELAAEAALLQARLDHFQTELAKLTGDPPAQ
ncbi:hypothetical protein G5C51_16505, partial [Streptomyces sp. A7024]|nr:hypothetical protein [Streptomyces coryli]